MRVEGRVEDVIGDFAVVSTMRNAACDGCHKKDENGGCSVCSLMGGERRFETKAINRVGAKVGDIVALESSSARMIGYASLVFILPPVLAVAFYLTAVSFIGGDSNEGEALPVLLAVGGFAVGLICAAVYSKLCVGSRVDVVVSEIVKRADTEIEKNKYR